MPRLADGRAERRMADVIVNAFGGRRKFVAENYREPVIDETQVDHVMDALMAEEGALGEFLESMMSEVENALPPSRHTSPRATRERSAADPGAAFASPRRASDLTS